MPDVIEISGDAIIRGAGDERIDPAVGAVSTFVGVTRGELRSDGVPLVALEYEAYREMALDQLRTLAAEARERWSVTQIAILHQTGRVIIGGASVMISVASPHRGEAFDACRFLIDELKKSVTIWKREVWADDSTSWVAGTLPAAP